MNRCLRAVFALAFVASACDAPASTEVDRTNLPDAPVGEALLDGANGGNPYAFILSPIGDDPDANLLGEFDDDVEPTVELCIPTFGDPVAGVNGCASVLPVSGGGLARWTVDDGPGNDVVTVDPVDQLYQTQLRMRLFDLTPGEVYRLQVRVDQNVLVAADIMLTDGGNGNGGGNGKGKGKNSGGSSVSVPPNTYVISSGNRTIPFKFRLDDGALCWDADNPTVIGCTSVTVGQGDPEVVVLTTSSGDDVVFDLPSGWVGDVDGEGQVDDITLTIEEVETSSQGGETTCFQAYNLGDPDFGNPERCFDVRADTDLTTDVDVDFTSATPPVLAFCPDPDVLGAIQGGNDNFLMTSVQQDAAGQVARVYPNVAPPAGFPGCNTQTAAASGLERFFAATWDRVLPVVNLVAPQPLHASARADLGFGGRILRLSTIFFWSRLPESIALAPANATVEFPGAPLQITVNEMFHHGPAPTPGNVVNVNWTSSDTNVATVDASGSVTPVAPGSTNITATATNVKGFNNQFMTSSSTITVVAAASVPAQSTATVTPSVDAGDPVQIQVQAKTSQGLNQPLGGDELVIAVTGANTTSLSVGSGIVDNNDGTYTASYTPAVAGQDQVAVTMQVPPNGPFQPVQGSPFGVAVTTPYSTTNFSALLGGAGGNQGFADCPAGQVAIGFDGTTTEWRNSTANLWAFGVLCSALDVNGEPTGVVTKAGGFGWGGPSNERVGDTPFSITCPSGLMAELTAYDNAFVGGVDAGCYSATQITDEEVGLTSPSSTFQVQHPTGAVGSPEIGACSAGHVATGIDVFDGYIVDAIAFRCTPIGDFYTPPPVFTADVNTALPSTTVAAGFGQMITLLGSGFPTDAGISWEQGGQLYPAFEFGASTTGVRARLTFNGNTPVPGPANLYITDATGAIASDPFPITVSTTPAAPQLVGVFDVNFASATTIASGDTIRVASYGTDTSGVEVLFTDGGGTSIANLISTTGGGAPFALASAVIVPSLLDGPVTIALRTTVNGVTSAPSGSAVLSVDNGVQVALNFTGVLGSNGTPAVADCPVGQAGVGLRGDAISWFGWGNFAAVEMGCRALNASGDPVGPTTWIGGFGSGTGNVTSVVPFSETCSSGLLVDLQAGLSNNLKVSLIETGCYNFGQISGQQVGQVPAVAGFTIDSAVGAQETSTVSGTCSPGHVATGLGAQQGQVMDAFAFRCSPIVGLLPG